MDTNPIVAVEDEDFFAVRSGKGKPFLVAKVGLSPATIEELRGYACGGKVDSYAGGGLVLKTLADEPTGTPEDDEADDARQHVQRRKDIEEDFEGGADIVDDRENEESKAAHAKADVEKRKLEQDELRRRNDGREAGSTTGSTIQSYADGGLVEGYADGGEVEEDLSAFDGGEPLPNLGVVPMRTIDAVAKLDPENPDAGIAADPYLAGLAAEGKLVVEPPLTEDAPLVEGAAPVPMTSGDSSRVSQHIAARVGEAQAGDRRAAFGTVLDSVGSLLGPVATLPVAYAKQGILDEVAPLKPVGPMAPPAPPPQVDPRAGTAPTPAQSPEAGRLRAEMDALLQGGGGALPQMPEYEQDPRIEESLAAQRVAARMEADLVEAEAQVAAKALERQAKALEDTKAFYTEQRALAKAKADAFRSDILASKIDPRRVFHNMDSGQKMMTLMGIALGSMGSALSGREDVTWKAFNDLIDRDIDAQKTDLGTKRTLLQTYLDEVKDVDAAEKLAKADVMESTASAIRLAGYRTAGEKARLNAEKLAAGFEMQAGLLRDAGVQKHAENFWKTEQAKAQIQGLADQKALARLQMAAGRVQEVSARDSYLRVLQGEGSLEDLAGLDPKARDMTVQLQSGKYALASGDTSATRIKDAQSNGRTYIGILDRLLKINEDGGRTLPFTASEAKALVEEALIAKNAGSGLGALDSKTEPIIRGIIQDPSSILRWDANTRAALSAARDVARLRVAEIEANNIHKPRVAGPAIGNRSAPGQGQ